MSLSGNVEKEAESIEQQLAAFASGLFQPNVTISTLLDSLAEAVIVVNKLGTVLFVNARAEGMFGYERTDMVGKPLDMILPQGLRDIHKTHMAEFFAAPRIRSMGVGLDLAGLRRDGTEFPVEISLSFIRTADNLFVIAFVSDITRRKQVDRMLHDRNQELEAFAHTLAHDIKNSVTVVTGFGSLLDGSLEELAPEAITAAVKGMVKTAEKLNHIVDGLLLFSTIGRDDIRVKPLAMSPIVDSAIERVRGVTEEWQAEIIKPDTFPASLGYESWVEEIWFNYISNAVKYGGTPPKIELGGTERADGYATFWVKDNGPGIDPGQQADIFEMYKSRKEKSQKGYGLGLSIVKRIVEKLDGTVDVKNAPGGGGVFSFSLPLAPKRPAECAPATQAI